MSYRQPNTGATSNLTTPGNIAVDAGTGGAVGTQKIRGAVGSVQEVCIHLKTQEDYAAGIHDILQGVGKISDKDANMDWGTENSFSSFGALQDYYKGSKFIIESIRIVTDDTDNWNYKLIFGFRNPNNRNNREEDFNLIDYADITGSGYAKSLVIPQTALSRIPGVDGYPMMPQNYLQISNMKVSTNMRIYLRIRRMETTGDYSNVTF